MASPHLLRGRVSSIGAHYVATIVTAARVPLFRDTSLARLAAAEIDRCAREGRIDSHAWVVMPDHVHWLLQLRMESLSRCVQAFKSRSALAVNAVQRTSGAVWQAGFHDHQLRNAEDLAAQIRYIVTNPLRAGLVEDIDEYPHWWCRWIARGDELQGGACSGP